MGSIQQALPIRLDTTLAELYEKQRRDANDTFVLVAVYPKGLHAATERYVYHDHDYTHIASTGVVDHSREAAQARVERAMGSIKFSFCAGRMPFAALDVESCPSFEKQLKENLKALDQDQQALVYTYQQTADVHWNNETQEYDNVKLVVRLPLDGMENMPVILAADTHYSLLSKRGLATAPFATPTCQIIDLGTAEEVADIQASKLRKIPTKIVSRYEEDAMTTIARRPLPFVVKLQQSTCGDGTFIVKTGTDRALVLTQLQYILPDNVSRTNDTNIHLRPATLIISDFVNTDPKNHISYAITFIVNRDGWDSEKLGFNIVGCVEQDLGEGKTWDGASISYPQQLELKEKFAETVMDVSRFLYLKGYYGMVGIDILEDLKGKQWVVDMNVRPPGSLILCLLRNHLFEYRKFPQASLISQIRMGIPKATFECRFKEEWESNRIIIHAWFVDDLTGADWASFVVAGMDRKDVTNLVEVIKDFEYLELLDDEK